MKYAVLVTANDTIAHMLGSSNRPVQTYVFPKHIGTNATPVICYTHEGLPFSAIELR